MRLIAETHVCRPGQWSARSADFRWLERCHQVGIMSAMTLFSESVHVDQDIGSLAVVRRETFRVCQTLKVFSVGRS